MMRWHIGRRTAAAALSVLAAGCASLVPPASTTGPEISATVAAPLRTFQDKLDLAGRLSVRYQGERREEALHGSFTWAQSPARTTVTLLSPLGQTVAVIDVTAQGAKLTQAGQAVRTASDVDTLTAEALGWPLPVSGMRQWLQGFGLDGSGQHFVATPRNSDITTREGWRIRYANWQDEASPQSLPRRIDLARSTEQAGDVSIRIVIDTWQEH
ncbi:lipoprotein insertase outer membrane protein LolB [Noviherbaspirillum saxi]|uniref:Outer-membrane lipoprotein LolB n=1 Tax=Noviherbaspirillum saxi TaxID=2320863 RepID=A0A3A3FP51_9BURK|nr:lipoprotein insertase outer membrane protein LolB [Noviherbaspirillum saxi]RJF97663.1 outer membrane lipoprotein LolB [Noviherbaspirillum saxi]